jgi:hypothetical protein
LRLLLSLSPLSLSLSSASDMSREQCPRTSHQTETTSDEDDEPDVEDSDSSSELWAHVAKTRGAWEKRAARCVDGRTRSSRQARCILNIVVEYRILRVSKAD